MLVCISVTEDDQMTKSKYDANQDGLHMAIKHEYEAHAKQYNFIHFIRSCYLAAIVCLRHSMHADYLTAQLYSDYNFLSSLHSHAFLCPIHTARRDETRQFCPVGRCESYIKQGTKVCRKL